jgi:hypothetical protein
MKVVATDHSFRVVRIPSVPILPLFGISPLIVVDSKFHAYALSPEKRVALQERPRALVRL